MPEPFYCTAAEVRTELGVDTTVLNDADGSRLIQDAEDVIDDALGIAPVDQTTGRKVVQTQVMAWQWTKVKRATLKVCRFLFQNPDWLATQRHASVGGDESVGSPYGFPVPAAAALLDDSGLREIVTHARGKPREDWIGNLPEPG